MRIRIVGSAVDGDGRGPQFAASYIVNDTVAIDAGCIGFLSSIDDQRRIRHVLLSHSHIDHIASLPIFLDNVHQPGTDCVAVYAHPVTLDCLRRDIFNDRVWPDLVRLSTAESRFVELVPLGPNETIRADQLQITALELPHVVSTLGFIVRDGKTTVAILSDTGSLAPVRATLNRLPRLDAVFLECAFPNRMEWLADCAEHLTPRRFAAEVHALTANPAVVAVHVKAAFRDEILAELAALNLPRLTIGESNAVYEF